ncbi:hypothetical protein T265_02324, partial [Opisthorchis viverrini]
WLCIGFPMIYTNINTHAQHHLLHPLLTSCSRTGFPKRTLLSAASLVGLSNQRLKMGYLNQTRPGQPSGIICPHSSVSTDVLPIP